jgi:hypothetical protein
MKARRLEPMQRYAQQEKGCRLQSILQYFSEEHPPCGRCDLCLKRKADPDFEFHFSRWMLDELQGQALESRSWLYRLAEKRLQGQYPPLPDFPQVIFLPELFLEYVRRLLEQSYIAMQGDLRYYLKDEGITFLQKGDR